MSRARGHLHTDQSSRNLSEAARVMEMLPEVDFTSVKAAIACGDLAAALDTLSSLPVPPSDYCPHPIITIANEIKNAIRYR